VTPLSRDKDARKILISSHSSLLEVCHCLGVGPALEDQAFSLSQRIPSKRKMWDHPPEWMVIFGVTYPTLAIYKYRCVSYTHISAPDFLFTI
jgi:hypothetical protein